MSKQTGLGCALYAGGFDLGGDSQSFTIHGGPAPLDFTDITQSAAARLGGLRDGGFDWTSFHDPAVGAEHDALSPLPTADVITTVFLPPVALGSPAISQVSKQVNYDPTRGQDGMLTFAINGQANAFGIEMNGLQLTPGRRVDTTATAAGPSNSINTLASASFGGQAYFHLFAFSGTSVTLTIWDSADNVTFAAVAGFTSGALTTAHTAVRDTIPNNATLRQYLAVASTGTFTSADFAVMVVKNPIANVVF